MVASQHCTYGQAFHMETHAHTHIPVCITLLFPWKRSLLRLHGECSQCPEETVLRVWLRTNTYPGSGGRARSSAGVLLLTIFSFIHVHGLSIYIAMTVKFTCPVLTFLWAWVSGIQLSTLCLYSDGTRARQSQHVQDDHDFSYHLNLFQGFSSQETNFLSYAIVQDKIRESLWMHSTFTNQVQKVLTQLFVLSTCLHFSATTLVLPNYHLVLPWLQY